MNWRKSIYISEILKSDLMPHDKADSILEQLAEAFKGTVMDEEYQVLIHDLILVRKTEELDHVLENLHKWAEKQMYWLG